MNTSGFSSDAEQPVESQPVESTPQQVETAQVEQSLGNQFLNKIPEQDRNIVAKYVKDWDGQVTKKFQEYSSKLKPWEALGIPIDEATKYIQFGKNFRTNPQARDELFRQMFGAYQQQFGDEFDTKLLELLQLQLEEQQEMNDPNYEGGQYEQPDEFTTFQDNVTAELEELREYVSSQKEAEETAQQMKQLDNIIEAMHTKYGDFDDGFMLSQFAAGRTIPEAIKAWNTLVSSISTQGQPLRQPPKTIGGGQGGVPNEQVKSETLRGADRKAAVMNALAALDQ